MQVQIKEEKGLAKKLEFTVPAEQVDKSFSQQFQKIQKTAKIPGFRQGKAPLASLKESYYHKVWQAVLDDLFQNFYPKALDSIQINPVGQAKLIDIKLEEKKDCKFLVEIETHPQVEVKNYRDLKIAKQDAKVTDKDAEESMNKLRESFSNYTDSLEDRPVKKDDHIVIDMRAFINAVPIKELTNPEVLLHLGENQVAPNFDDNFMGLKIGQEKSFDFVLPKDHPYEKIANQKVSFQVKIKSLKRKDLPKKDDEFAKKFKIDTFKELEIKVRKDLEDLNLQKSQEKREDEVISKLVEANPLDLPQTLIEDQKKKLIGNAKKRLEGYKLTPQQQDAWVKEQDKHFEKEAKLSLHASYLIEKLIEDLKIKTTPEDIEKSLKESFPDKKPEDMEKELKQKNYWQGFLFNLTRKKVIDQLLEFSKN